MDKVEPALVRLAKLRAEIRVEKTGKNKFQNFEYFTLPDIYSAAKPLLAKYNLVTSFGFNREGEFDIARLVVVDALTGTTIWSSQISAWPHIDYDREGKKKGSPCQWAGSTNTYLSKYLYMNLFMLSEDSDDPDSTASQVHPVDKNEINDLKKLFSSCDSTQEVTDIWKGLSKHLQSELTDHVSMIGKKLKEKELTNA